jgi:uncharacterized protein with von Willebrand factor type A (vWA) domain
MFVFFHDLKAAGVPLTLRYPLEAMEKDLAGRRVETSTISRAALVKDERNLDKFDRVFGRVQGLPTDERCPVKFLGGSSWRRNISPTKKKQIEPWGLDKLLDSASAEGAKGRHRAARSGSAPPACRSARGTIRKASCRRMKTATAR